MTLKLIMLFIISVCAVLALCAGFIVGKKERKNNKGKKENRKEDYKNLTQNRNVVKMRLICFLIMLVCLFICMFF